MGRNNERNIKKHNDKLHKEQDKAMCLKMMTEEAIELYNSSPKLKGKKVFLKHV